MTPLVSVLIPCYNAEPWIAQCIESALSQTHGRLEIVVFDDGSQDRSLSIIRRYEDRIRIYSAPNRGVNVVRNELLSLSRGDWLSFLDADDFIFPDKIARQLEILHRQPQADAIYSRLAPMYPRFSDDPAVLYGEIRESEYEGDEKDVYQAFFRWSPIGTSGLLLRKSTLVEVGGWREPICHEHELLLRFLVRGKTVSFVPGRAGIYRLQSINSISRSQYVAASRDRARLCTELETHLVLTQKFSDDRRTAFAQSTLMLARSLYSRDRRLASSLCAKALQGWPFIPPQQLSIWYLRLLRVLGFGGVEFVAALYRQLLKWMPCFIKPLSLVALAHRIQKRTSSEFEAVAMIALKIFARKSDRAWLTFDQLTNDRYQTYLLLAATEVGLVRCSVKEFYRAWRRMPIMRLVGDKVCLYWGQLPRGERILSHRYTGENVLRVSTAYYSNQPSDGSALFAPYFAHPTFYESGTHSVVRALVNGNRHIKIFFAGTCSQDVYSTNFKFLMLSRHDIINHLIKNFRPLIGTMQGINRPILIITTDDGRDTTAKHTLSLREYIKTMACSNFFICPPGWRVPHSLSRPCPSALSP